MSQSGRHVRGAGSSGPASAPVHVGGEDGSHEKTNGLRNGRKCPLPLHPYWNSQHSSSPEHGHVTAQAYVSSLLHFATTSDLFRNLCGGVHILDFLTRKPDLYEWVLPSEWRTWFENVEIMDLLDLLLREDLAPLLKHHQNRNQQQPQECDRVDERNLKWRRHDVPPSSLLLYIETIRVHSLDRALNPDARTPNTLPRHIAVGMKPKKMHEVLNFAAFVERLKNDIANDTAHTEQGEKETTTTFGSAKGENTKPLIIDFGSGQNYLGRVMASAPYHNRVVAIEQRHNNVEGARGMDVHAKLAEKEKIMRNKKEYKRLLAQKNNKDNQTFEEEGNDNQMVIEGLGLRSKSGGNESQLIATDQQPTPVSTTGRSQNGSDDKVFNTMTKFEGQGTHKTIGSVEKQQKASTDKNPAVTVAEPAEIGETFTCILPPPEKEKGSIIHVERQLHDGYLEDIISPLTTSSDPSPSSIVVSIHSCGNLTHHGLRSLTANPSVRAVAMIGCCYNLLTERLGPATYKLPQLRPNHPRLEATGSTYDEHGFPMSKRLEQYEYPVSTRPDRRFYFATPQRQRPKARATATNGSGCLAAGGSSSARLPHSDDADQTLDEDRQTERESGQDQAACEKGVRLNITARMMAVQAPYNWGEQDSNIFFTRHFYRALLQRILLDLDVVKMHVPGGTTTSTTATTSSSSSFSSSSSPASAPASSIASSDRGKTVDSNAVLYQTNTAGGSLSGKDEAGTPLIIGSLKKSCFTSFEAYVKGALEKLWADPKDGPAIRAKTEILLLAGSDVQVPSSLPGEIQAEYRRYMETSVQKKGVDDYDDDDVQGKKRGKNEERPRLPLVRFYEAKYQRSKHYLSIVWSLMAFSAGVVESLIVVDRWLWLMEQQDNDEEEERNEDRDEGEEKNGCDGNGKGKGKGEGNAWVESVFDYSLSPRNLVVVGVKKDKRQKSR